MRLIERLHMYREYHAISVAVFEKTCGLGNGYLGKQLKGKGSVGSDILEKISQRYPDLNLEWLITGKGRMIKSIIEIKTQDTNQEIREDAAVYIIRNKLIGVLKEQLQLLESSVPSVNKRSKSGKKK